MKRLENWLGITRKLHPIYKIAGKEKIHIHTEAKKTVLADKVCYNTTKYASVAP